MEPRPRVSRETRLLFVTIIVAIVALWVLARIRFPDRPAPVNPVAPVLTQLAPTPTFGDLAATVADVQPSALLPFVAVQLQPGGTVASGDAPPDAVAALRVRDDVAIALLDPGLAQGEPVDATVLNLDPATGLAALKVPPQGRGELNEWVPRRLDAPRYVLTTVASREGLSLRPVFVSTLGTSENVTWGATVWTAPPRTDLTPGAFAFTSSGALAGLIIRHEDRAAILPQAALAAAADRLLGQHRRTPGSLGLNVQALTPALAAATGAAGGAIVTWVDPDGPAAGSIQATDVLEAFEDAPTSLTEQSWVARTARMEPGESVTVRVRRGALTQPVRLTATERQPSAPSLGLAMRRVRSGVEVVHVEAGSAAARAGIQAGDVITVGAGVAAPTPSQIGRAFAAGGDRPLVFGLTRGESHLVVVVNTR